MNWTRIVLGPPGRGVGKGRWPLSAILALVATVISIMGGFWTYAILFLAAAIVFGVLTIRSAR